MEKSKRDIELDKILDKISSNISLSKLEQNFLNNFNSDFDIKEYAYLSKNRTFIEIGNLLRSKNVVICDLKDRNGKISLPILRTDNKFNENKCILYLEKNKKALLKDSFLYNIFYNQKKGTYHLTEQDEYFEKVRIDK